MGRRHQPKQPQQPAEPNALARIARTISDWRVVIGAVVGVFVCVGTAFAFVGKLATKEDLVPLQEHDRAHNDALIRIDQHLQDLVDMVRDIHDAQMFSNRPHK